MPARRIIVVGGVAAGPAAVAEARRTDAEAEIILIERGGDISYSACEMPIFLAGELADADRLVRYDAERFSSRFRCAVRLHTEVVSVEPSTRHVDVVDGRTGEQSSLWYDALVLATGVEASVPETLRTASHQVHVLRRLEDAREIRRHLDAAKKGHVVVVGAGYVGLDGVEAFHRAGWRCTLLSSGGRFLGQALDPDAAGWVRTALERDGVAVRDE
ncbi:MAG: FAD-dependent oxidoreductase, partial [Bacteroidetes bacterium]|nr:FAD-dependent oxidoreductase [Bacteroidota bacterium]